jgi:hypothetical protein
MARVIVARVSTVPMASQTRANTNTEWRPFDKAETINCGQSKEGIVIEAKTICKLNCEGKRKIIVLEGS